MNVISFRLIKNKNNHQFELDTVTISGCKAVLTISNRGGSSHLPLSIEDAAALYQLLTELDQPASQSKHLIRINSKRYQFSIRGRGPYEFCVNAKNGIMLIMELTHKDIDDIVDICKSAIV